MFCILHATQWRHSWWVSIISCATFVWRMMMIWRFHCAYMCICEWVCVHSNSRMNMSAALLTHGAFSRDAKHWHCIECSIVGGTDAAISVNVRVSYHQPNESHPCAWFSVCLLFGVWYDLPDNGDDEFGRLKLHAWMRSDKGNMTPYNFMNCTNNHKAESIIWS